MLRKWRESAGLSQRAVAELLGDDQAYVSRIESGRRHLTVQGLLSYLLAIGHTLSDKAHEIQSLVEDPHRSLWQNDF